MTEIIYCACGCGNPIIYRPCQKYHHTTYIRGHSNKGKTAKDYPPLASLAEKKRGQTKENNAVVAAMAEKLRGRTKETSPSIAAQAAKLRGRTAKDYPYLVSKLKGRTKESHPSIASMAEKLRGHIPWNKGRTAERDPVVARVAEQKRGKTKENDAGRAMASIKMRGRTKETHKYLAIISEKLRGDKSVNWRGGISFEPYTTDFTEELKATIRQRDKWRCQKCGVPQIECIKKLAIHHIDFNKANDAHSNLISLCLRCNTQVNYNREYWANFFQVILKEREQWLLITT